MLHTHIASAAVGAASTSSATGQNRSEQPECLCGARDFKLVREGRFGFFPVDGKPVPFRVLSCTQCGLCVTAPRPGQHIAFERSAEAADVEVEAMDDSPMLLDTSRYRLEKIQRRLGVPGAALEIGCSTGPLVELLSQAGSRISVGVELHRPAVAGALKRGRNVRGITLQACEFSEESFDLVQAHHVLEHVADLHGLLREVRRVLRIGGLAFFTVPCHDSPLARSDNWSGWFPQEHFWHFQRNTLLPLLAQHGLGRFQVARPLLTDFVPATSSLGAVKRLARSTVRELGLGDTLEVWAERLT
jgi:SAM-dependent methyltransferase